MKTQSQIASCKMVHKPPPIIVYGIEDLSNQTDLPNKAVPSGTYLYKIVNKDQLRIVTLSTESQRPNGTHGPGSRLQTTQGRELKKAICLVGLSTGEPTGRLTL